jgi:hypothetical protein
VIISNELLSQKHLQHKIATDFGMSIRVNPEQRNANDSIRVNLDGDSNVISSNDLHSAKDSEHKISTDFGIVIRFNPEQRNANDSIRVNIDGDSNVIISNDLFSEKHSEHKISIDFGITTVLISPKYRINSRPLFVSRNVCSTRK